MRRPPLFPWNLLHSRTQVLFLLILCSTLSWINTSRSAEAKPKALLIPLQKAENISVPMLKSFDLHVRQMMKGVVSLIDLESTRSAVQSAECGDRCTGVREIVKIGKLSEVRFIFAIDISVADEIYALNLQLFDGARKKIFKVKEECEFCDESEVKAQLTNLIKAKKISSELLVAPPAPVVSAKPQLFALKITSAPEGAQVFVNQQPTGGVTPLILEDLEKGEYTIGVKLKGYDDQKRVINTPPQSSKDPIQVTFQLITSAPKRTIIKLKTDPGGAAVFLDGDKVQGVTPLSLDVMGGAHTVRLKLEGYDEKTVTFDPNNLDQKKEIIANLTKSPPKKVTPVAVTPPPPTAPIASPPPTSSPTMIVPPRPGLLSSGLSGALIGLGAIATGVGGWLLFLHGEVSCNDGRDRFECPDVYDSRVSGTLTFGVGMTSLGFGLALSILSTQWKNPKKRITSTGTAPSSDSSVKVNAPTLTPTEGGALMQWGGTF